MLKQKRVNTKTQKQATAATSNTKTKRTRKTAPVRKTNNRNIATSSAHLASSPISSSARTTATPTQLSPLNKITRPQQHSFSSFTTPTLAPRSIPSSLFSLPSSFQPQPHTTHSRTFFKKVSTSSSSAPESLQTDSTPAQPETAVEQTVQSTETTALVDNVKAKKTLPADVVVTNENFNAPAVVDRPVHTIDPLPEVVTEDLLLDKIKYEAKVKGSRKFRFSEYLKDHQPQVRAAILAIPSLAVMWATHDFSMYLASLTDQLGQSAETTSNMLMALGGAQALMAYGLFDNANKILSLAGQPSEPVVQEIIRRSLKNPELNKALGGHFKIGHFVSVSTRSGGPRWTNNKARHYEEWLQHDAGKFTQPIPDIPAPGFVQNYLSLFPAFQSSAWNAAVSEKIALDMRKHPEDYLDDSESSEEEINQAESKLADSTTTTKSSTKLLDGKSSEQTAPLHPVESQPQQLNEQALKQRKNRITHYSGWERFWKPRRLQFTAHLIGPNDEGLVLCEVEKLNYGPSHRGSGGMTSYKVFQYVSLKTGQVTNIDQSERPSLLSHAHVEQMFDTIPVVFPVVSHASFDHILVEDKYKKETKQYVEDEKKKVAVGIYH